MYSTIGTLHLLMVLTLIRTLSISLIIKDQIYFVLSFLLYINQLPLFSLRILRSSCCIQILTTSLLTVSLTVKWVSNLLSRSDMHSVNVTSQTPHLFWVNLIDRWWTFQTNDRLKSSMTNLWAQKILLLNFARICMEFITNLLDVNFISLAVSTTPLPWSIQFSYPHSCIVWVADRIFFKNFKFLWIFTRQARPERPSNGTESYCAESKSIIVLILLLKFHFLDYVNTTN